MVIDTDIEEELVTGYEDREYQVLGTKFLSTLRRAFLTDDPGLGKTVQAIRAAELPCMIVAPRYLTGQWADAILREHPDAIIAHADGTRKQRDKVLSRRADWYIVNIEMMATYDMPDGIRTYINDEAHHLRNRRALQSKAAALVENHDTNARIYNLTATPFYKSVDDIWHQAHILYPKQFTSYHQFVKLYCNSLLTPFGGRKVVGVKPRMKADLKALLAPIMLGRTYAQVGRFLPDIVENTIKLELTPTMRAVYDKLVTEFTLKWMDEEEQKRLIFQPTTVLHALRQITAQSGKMEAIENILEDNINEQTGKETPAVIGFWYKDHARMMQARLGDARSVLITGDIDAVERQRRALRAQAQKKHIVASERSLAEGINLYEYRMFIAGEEDYVPGRNHQFLSRVVRDRNDGGRDREPVRVYYVQVSKTIDTAIHRIAKSRKTSIQATRELLELTLKTKEQ